MKASVGWLILALLNAPGADRLERACRVCDCITPGSPTEERDRAAAVLRVRVDRVDDRLLAATDTLPRPARDPEASAWIGRYAEQRHVHARVLRVWKGTLRDTVTVFTSLGGGDCGYPFEPGVEYLVYARSAPSGRLVTSICSRTSPISRAAEDLAALGPGFQPRE